MVSSLQIIYEVDLNLTNIINITMFPCSSTAVSVLTDPPAALFALFLLFFVIDGLELTGRGGFLPFGPSTSLSSSSSYSFSSSFYSSSGLVSAVSSSL